MTNIQKKLINAGVKRLQEYGYKSCNKKNILTDKVYSAFFKSILEDNKGNGIDDHIDSLINSFTVQ